MPFEPGNQLAKGLTNSGRKGYEWEQQSLEKMRKILDRDIEMVNKIQEEVEIDDKTQKKLILLKERIKIYSDKLHIPKIDLTTKGESINVNPKTLEIAKEYEKKLNEEEDKKSQA